MKTVTQLVAAIAVATASATIVAEEVQTQPVFAPYAPVAMSAADQEKMAEQHKAFIEQQTAALEAMMAEQRKFAESFAADQAQMMEQGMPAPYSMPEMPEFKRPPMPEFAMPEMPAMPEFQRPAMPEMAAMPKFERPAMPEFAMPAMPAMPEMPAPMAMNDLPQPPAFDAYTQMDPQARRDAMKKFHEEMRQAMQQRRDNMRKQMDERRDELKKQIEERRATVAKDRAALKATDA